MTEESPGACSIHGVPLIVEPGGPDAVSIDGRTYCPVCQEQFIREMDRQAAEEELARNVEHVDAQSTPPLPIGVQPDDESPSAGPAGS